MDIDSYNRRRLVLIATAWCVALFFNMLAHADDKEIFDKVLADWNQRRALIRTLTVHATGKAVIPKGSWTGKKDFPPGEIPETNLSTGLSREIFIDFDSSKVRFDALEFVVNVRDATTSPSKHKRIFDNGELRTFFYDDPGNPDVRINVRPDLDSSDKPLLIAFGCFPVSGDDQISTALKRGFGHLEPHRIESLDGVTCAVFRSRPSEGDGFREYWMDPARAGVIVKYYQVSHTGNPRSDVNYSYEPVESEEPTLRWKLSSLEMKNFRVGVPEVTLSSIKDLNTITIQFNEPLLDQTFDMSIADGLSIYDYTSGRTIRERESAQEEPIAATWLIVSVAVAMVFAVVLGCYFRQRSKAKTTSA